MSDAERNESCERWKRDAAIAGAAALGASVLVGTSAYALGQPSDAEARVLMESMIPTSRFLCSAIMTATATILALMLTLLGMSVKADVNLSTTFYQRIRQIAFYDMLLLVAASVFLVLHCIPITKSDQLPDWWYPTLYYSVLVAAAMLAGAIVGIVVLLYNAVRDLIAVFGEGEEAHRIVAEDCETNGQRIESDAVSSNA